MDTTTTSAPRQPATNGGRTRGTVGEAEQAEWLARFEASGQSVRAFCAEHGLVPTTLTWWRRRRRERARCEGEAGALIEVTPARAASRQPVSARSSVSSTAVAVIVLPLGRRVEIGAGSDPAWVAALLQALG